MKHIGIVACSAEGAALCYRAICATSAKRLGGYTHPDVSLHSHSFEDYVSFLNDDDWDGVADLMVDSADRLMKSGADVLVCPDNTIHRALPRVVDRTGLPWLHIAEAVAEEASRRGFRRLAILGTRWLVDSAVYPEKLAARNLAYSRPSAGERDEINRIIFEELVYGDFKPASVEYVRGVIERFAAAGCDSVVLGCTELPLVIDASNSALPPLDSTRLLAAAAVEAALN